VAETNVVLGSKAEERYLSLRTNRDRGMLLLALN